MREWIFLPLLLLMMATALSGLSACGSSSSNDNNDGNSNDISAEDSEQGAEDFPYDDPSASLNLIDPDLPPGSTDIELPPGSDTAPAPNRELNAFYQALTASGGELYLKYNQAKRGQIFNVRIDIDATDVQTEPTSGVRYADIDIGGQLLRIANGAMSTSSLPVMQTGGSDPADLLLLKTYTRASRADGSLAAPELQSFALFERDNLQNGAVGVEGALDLGLSALPEDCELQAWEIADELPPTAVKFPPLQLNSCSLNDCAHIKAAWIRALHDVYRIRQMLGVIAAEPNKDKRAFMWKQPAADADGFKGGQAWSLAYYFGDYAGYRFDAIRQAYNRLWDDMQDHNLEGLKLDFECRPTLAGDVCNTTSKVPAHHVVKSNIKICSEFFDTPVSYRPLLMVHEMLHHTAIPWKDGSTPRLSMIQDTHTHGHGGLCLNNVSTEKHYGIDKVRHLATYKVLGGGTCFHRNFAFRNNDTYGWATRAIGQAVRMGEISYWPYKETGAQPPNDDPCNGAPIPPGPPPDIDPLDDCQKINTEYVCPGSGIGGGSINLPNLDIGMECPPGS